MTGRFLECSARWAPTVSLRSYCNCWRDGCTADNCLVMRSLPAALCSPMLLVVLPLTPGDNEVTCKWQSKDTPHKPGTRDSAVAVIGCNAERRTHATLATPT